jgi:hypothetical protein
MEISRFPGKRLLRMPGSTTTRGQQVSCDIATGCVAFCRTENIGTPNLSYAAQYLACALPCERFTSALADTHASLGASAVRYSFTVTDFHRLPFAGLPAHPSTASGAELTDENVAASNDQAFDLIRKMMFSIFDTASISCCCIYIQFSARLLGTYVRVRCV